MTPLPDALVRALDDALDEIPTSRLAPIVERLIGDYRTGRAGTGTAILRTHDDAAAYAAYRMPATYAAVREALGQAAAVADPAPRTLVDVGGGTGAAVWAAADAWPSLAEATVLEGTDAVITLGRRLARAADVPAVAGATFRRLHLDAALTLPHADLITVSYVLGELDEATRTAVVREAAARAGTVAVVEPGTPHGYRRVLAARDELLAAGFTVVAPCPHDGRCPMRTDEKGAGIDWCHFAARVNRTSRHRRLKSADLGHEDEKFAHVVAVRAAAPAHAANRVVRHPLQRKGLVTLRLCTGEGGITDRPVPKSRREDYRAARDTSWGDAWPPAGRAGS